MVIIPPHPPSSAAAPAHNGSPTARRSRQDVSLPSAVLHTTAPGHTRDRPRLSATPRGGTRRAQPRRTPPCPAAPCPDDTAGVLRIASPWCDPPGTAGLRTVAAAPKSIVRKYFRLILASCNATLSQKISADHLHHDPTVLDTHPAAFYPLDQDLPFFRTQRDAWRWLRHAPPLVQHHGM